jgi:hypothetical protein
VGELMQRGEYLRLRRAAGAQVPVELPGQGCEEGFGEGAVRVGDARGAQQRQNE